MITSFQRLAACVIWVLLLGGCADTEIIRGRLKYDLRPEAEQKPVFWPRLPDTPRYFYSGELVGEPNFEDLSSNTEHPVITALKWIAGLFESRVPVLLQRPHHGTVDDKGRVYVVDTGRNAVVVFDPTAPAEEKSDRGEGQMLVWESIDETTRFAGPVAASMVWNGDIAVSDARLGLVARLNRSGQFVAKIGLGQLQRPTGLAFDPARKLLYVADTLADSIKVFDEQGKLVNSFGSPGDGIAELNAPTHLSFANGQLYVSDTLNSRIQVFDADGKFIRQFGRRGLFVGDMPRPKGVAVGEQGIVHVIESLFGHMLAFNQEGKLLLAMNGSGLKDGEFFLPSGVWTDAKGRVFIADMFNGRVVTFQFLNTPNE